MKTEMIIETFIGPVKIKYYKSLKPEDILNLRKEILRKMCGFLTLTEDEKYYDKWMKKTSYETSSGEWLGHFYVAESQRNKDSHILRSTAAFALQDLLKSELNRYCHRIINLSPNLEKLLDLMN